MSEIALDNRKITYVKYERLKKRTEIHWECQVNERDFYSYSFHHYDEPLNSFLNVLADLREQFLYIIQAKDTWQLYKVNIQSCTIGHKQDDNFNATITGLIEVDTSNSPVVINTPNLPALPYNNSTQHTLPDECSWMLENLMAEAKKYIDGQRKDPEQKSLFDLQPDENGEVKPNVLTSALGEVLENAVKDMKHKGVKVSLIKDDDPLGVDND